MIIVYARGVPEYFKVGNLSHYRYLALRAICEKVMWVG